MISDAIGAVVGLILAFFAVMVLVSLGMEAWKFIQALWVQTVFFYHQTVDFLVFWR